MKIGGIATLPRQVLPLLLAIAALALGGCADAPTEPPQEPGSPEPPETPEEPENPENPDGIVVSEVVTPDPSGHAPLTALLDLETSIPVSLELRVPGRHGAGSDVIRRFTETAVNHGIPILGLYADQENIVELTLYDVDGEELETRTYTIQTPPAGDYLPEIAIDEAVDGQMVEGMTLVSYFGHAGTTPPMRPFIFDRFGDVRWVLDYEGHPDLGELDFNDGVERLANGNLYFGDETTDRIYEVDMTGTVLNSWDMPGYGFHHEALEMPNGNFLVSVHNLSASTVEDHVIEIDRASSAIVSVWDLRESLDPLRRTWSDDEEDWAHINAVAYDEDDDTIIVSARHQGVLKLTRANELVWILAPHRGWEVAGDGTVLSNLLLQPLDAMGQPITEPAVLEGDANHPDFEWNWYQHAPLIMPDGNLLLFDNGDNRNYVDAGPYSRAVEFAIDEEEATVRQVWSYGKERGAETYSRIVSDVDYHADENHVVFSPGAVEFGGSAYGRAIEVDRASGTVLFEATITPPQTRGPITLHRTERLTLYPGD